MRRLLIVEYLSAGLMDLAEASPSMLAEGKAMLTGLLQDAGRMDGNAVATLWSDHIGERQMAGVEFRRTTSRDHACDAWRSALSVADAVYVIAPETDGILQCLCGEAADAGAQVFNCTSRAIGITADKWETFRTLSAAGIVTIPSQLLSEYVAKPAFESPHGLVIKPRDGCGSEGIRIVKGSVDLLPSNDDHDQWIVQPFLESQPASVAVIFDDCGQPYDVFPLALQQLTAELKYQGGRIPADVDLSTPGASQLTTLAKRIGDAIPGLRGYVGIDLLLQPDGACIVVEINPRLTTSYIGYRALTETNLAERWLSADSGRQSGVSWSAGGVSFSADGRVTLSG